MGECSMENIKTLQEVKTFIFKYCSSNTGKGMKGGLVSTQKAFAPYLDSIEFYTQNILTNTFNDKLLYFFSGSNICEVCGREFSIRPRTNTCSDECYIKYLSKIRSDNPQGAVNREFNLKYCGESNFAKLDSVKLKIKNTINKNPLYYTNRKNTHVTTCMKKYGVSYPITLPEVLLKREINNLSKYNVRHTLQLHNVQEKREATLFRLYGVHHQMHVTDIFDKQQKHRWKDYIFPSGKIVKVQGYEQFALDYLLNNYEECDLIIERKLMPKIFYTFENKIHRYYPDIYIPKENLIIEVKSDYTATCDIEKNLAKKIASIAMGFKHITLIFNKKELTKIE